MGVRLALSRLWDKMVFFAHFFRDPMGLSTPTQCSRKIVETIESVSQDRTLVVATHDTGLRRIATDLYEMEEGRLRPLAEGSALGHERSRVSRSPSSRPDDASQ